MARLRNDRYGVDFDIDFLKRLNLNPDAWLSYRKFDLTTLRRYIRFLDCPEDPLKGAW